MKIGDLVKATPLSKWEVNEEDFSQIGIVTEIRADTHERDRYQLSTQEVILLNFGNDDGIFRATDWKFEVLSENR